MDYQELCAQNAAALGYVDFDEAARPLIDRVRPFTMTSMERLFALYKSVEYIVKAKVPGDFVECGVWRGGSMMLVALSLLSLGDTSRTLYLFDTFAGHPKPDPVNDVTLYGDPVPDEAAQSRVSNDESDWCVVTVDEVRTNMIGTGYPPDRIALVKGRVENTAAANAPERISLLRLDTDWYSAAQVELDVFWPRLSRRGVMILDDYGHYPSQRRATDEYFANDPQMLSRVDYSCRLIVKTG